MKNFVRVILFTAVFLCGGNIQVNGAPTNDVTEVKIPVVFIHGGAIDDSVSYLLLTSMENIDLLAVIVTNTDSIPDFAMQIQWKIQKLIRDTTLPLGLSQARGWNAFPWLYRADAIRQSKIEILAGLKNNESWPPYPDGDNILRDILSEAVKKNAPVTLLVTCPVTTVSDLLKINPELEKGIARMIWMGGAVNVAGNLDKDTIAIELANPEAEWNVFWDPFAVAWIFENTSFPIVLFPLDVTDQVPITENFLKELKIQAAEYQYSRVVYQSYLLTADQPFYEMWNTVTTAYLAHPEYFSEPTLLQMDITKEGYSQGALRKVLTAGRPVKAILDLPRLDRYYSYVLEELKRDYID